MQCLAPTPASVHSTRTKFIHPLLSNCPHVFVIHSGIKRPLQMPYKILHRSANHFTLRSNNKPATISVDRIKPCFHIQANDLSIKSALPLLALPPVTHMGTPSGEETPKSIPSPSVENTSSSFATGEHTAHFAPSRPDPITTTLQKVGFVLIRSTIILRTFGTRGRGVLWWSLNNLC